MPRFETTVVAGENDSFDAFCNDTVLNEPCFRSTGWGTQEEAKARINEHLYEHAEGVPARELGAFKAGVTQERYEEHVLALHERNKVTLPEGFVPPTDQGGAE